MEAPIVERPSAKDWIESVLYVVLTGMFAIILGATVGHLLIVLTLCHRYAICTRAYAGNVAISIGLIVAVVCAGFAQGAALKRRLSVFAVPTGWLLIAVAGWLWLAYPFCREGLLCAVGSPALASISARRGDLYSATKRRRHLLWLVALCVLFTLVVVFNEALYDLLPNSVRARLW